ncbi:ABC transporter permease [Adhaeribacter radiodurans]|uniref:ABC transporter permease n=1 Tax=Adhaeribacter radiodurans TaxID=2745197 RepID=A0A7L7L8P7_9BACT|nr:FtsX-like permease family protein [Adhaeribacter radiodurans]QMU29191.1 ABC transporter permease [Adhaeribacter radiodurans]
MNISKYISRKIGGTGGDSFTSSVTKIAIISIAVGLAIMIVSFAILQGFRNEIQRKIFSFGAHLQISKYDTNNSFEGKPINTNAVVKNLKGIPEIQHYQPYAFKTAIIKTDEEVYGVVLKGVDKNYDFKPMQQNLVAGKVITFSDSAATNDIMISNQVASKLRIKLGDKVSFFFIQNPPRARRFTVTGIFKTGLEEFDQVYVLADMQHIRDLNKWSDTVVTGYEIMLKDFNKIDTVAATVFNRMNYDLQLEKVTDQYAQLFDWMKLLNQNVIIFLILIIFVATFNMVSSIFIMILERTNMIGLLKALGATDPQIRQVFFFKGLQLTLKGLIYGNLIGLGFCAIQYFTKIIPLDPENYYMDTVPIAWSPGIIIILNVITLVLTMMAIMIPTYMISRIKPVTAIRFD